MEKIYDQREEQYALKKKRAVSGKSECTGSLKIVQTNGCTAGGWMISGKRLEDHTDDEIYAVVGSLLGKLGTLCWKDPVGKFPQLLECFEYDSFECDGKPCEQCGDVVDVTTWNL